MHGQIDTMGSSDQEAPPKLRRGRISLERKKEILEQYDQLGQVVGSVDAAAMFGITEATLAKLITERDVISKTVPRTAAPISAVKSEGASSCSASRRGRLSLERKREILAQYKQLQPCSAKDAAVKLGVKEATLLNILASKRKLRATKRKLDDLSSKSSSDGEDSAKNSRIRENSPQPGSSGLSATRPSRNGKLNMSLREGRRVRVDYSEEEQSGSDYVSSGSDSERDVDEPFGDKVRKRPYYTAAQRQQILAKFDEMQPCSQNQAAPKLGITVSTLCVWLKQRNLERKKSIRKAKEAADVSWSGEEIDCYVVEPKGSKKGSQVVQFFDVAEERCKKEYSEGEEKKPHKPHLTLKERYELFKKYDSMVSSAQWDAAANLNLPKAVWSDMITNRYYWEERYRMRLQGENAILKKYDEVDKLHAAKILGIAKSKLDALLANRSVIEQDLAELETRVNDADSLDLNDDASKPVWHDIKQLESLEEELSNWLLQAKRNQVHVDWRALKEKSKELAANFGMEGFNPSNAWLRKWNSQYRMFWNQKETLVTVYDSGENRIVTESLLKALKVCPPDNVFNLVETGLYFRAIPGHPPVTDDWLVVAFACNMSGTERKKLLVVGNCKSPLCFKVIPIPLEYRYSKIPCMNEDIITSYLQAWDEELESSNQKVALIMDSSSSHRNLHLKRIRLFFVPEDCSKKQPLNDGVIASAKELYRTRIAESLREVQSSNGSNPAQEISLVDALFALGEAWRAVPKSILVSAFLKSAFPQNHSEDSQAASSFKQNSEAERLSTLDEDIAVHSDTMAAGDVPILHVNDPEKCGLLSQQVVHIEGTVKLSDEEEEDFDIEGWLTNEDFPDGENPANNSPNLKTQLEAFLNSKSPGSANADKKSRSPSASVVKSALKIIKRFLQTNGCTLEDLTDFTQLETKVLSKL